MQEEQQSSAQIQGKSAIVVAENKSRRCSGGNSEDHEEGGGMIWVQERPEGEMPTKGKSRKEGRVCNALGKPIIMAESSRYMMLE